MRRDPQRLADSEQAHRYDDDADPVGKLRNPERQPLLTGRLVDADQPNRQTENQRDGPRIRDAPSTEVTATKAKTINAK